MDTATANFKEVSKFSAPVAGNVVKVTGYVSGLGATSGSQPVRAVIYANSSGNPGALLGVSNPVTITAGQAWGWVDFTFPSPVAVSAGTVWMGYIAGTTTDLTQVRYDPVAGDLRYNTNSGGYAGGPSNPFGSPLTIGFHYSMYGTYAGASNSPPVPTIATPQSSLTWKVGDRIDFSGSATDPEDGTLPATALTWSLLLHHCYSATDCHIHFLQTFNGVASGFFNGPDHGYPSYLELQLTATDSQGASTTTSVNLQPQTIDLTFASNTPGLQLVFDSGTQATPYSVTVIIGSTHSISAPVSQVLGGTTYNFSSWSDGGAATHNITAPGSDASYTATYTASGGGNNPPAAVASGAPTSGTAPLQVNFDGSGSSDPDAGDTISYSWDLNGDGTFGDSTVAKPSFTYPAAGTYNAVLKVTDNHGASATSAPVTITVSSSGGSTFGTTTPGSSVDTATANFKEVSKFSAPVAGNVVKVTGYVSGLGATSGSQPVRAVIYANSSGNPGALLGVSNPVTITAGQAWGWVDFTFPSPVAVSAGTVWMGYIAGTTTDLTQVRYDPVAGDLRYNTNSGGYAGGPSNPFGSPLTIGFHYSMYGTYG